MNFSEAFALQLAGGVVRPAIFFRLATDPVIRIWGGVGDFALAADNIETAGGVYQGWGELNDIPALAQLINGVASRVDFAVSGVGPVAARLADEEAEDIRGRRVNLGVMALGSDWQPVSTVAWLWEGEADTLIIDSRLDGDQRIETLTLSVASIFTGRRRPRYRHYTDAEQRRRSPDDRYCERVSLYAQEYTKVWPRF